MNRMTQTVIRGVAIVSLSFAGMTPASAQSWPSAGLDQPWIANLPVYRSTDGTKERSAIDPELRALAEQDGPERVHVVLELGSVLLPDEHEVLSEQSIDLLERLRPTVWLASAPLQRLRGDRPLPVAVRSVRLVQPEEKLSDEVRLGQWGPYGMLEREGKVPLRLTLHRDAACDHVLRYVSEIFESGTREDDRTIDLWVPVHMIRWVAALDQVRSVEIDRYPPES